MGQGNAAHANRSSAFRMLIVTAMKRPQSVRDYVMSRGIASDRITSEGLGSARPVADTTRAEGRANNRRVEIVVQPTAAP